MKIYFQQYSLNFVNFKFSTIASTIGRKARNKSLPSATHSPKTISQLSQKRTPHHIEKRERCKNYDAPSAKKPPPTEKKRRGASHRSVTSYYRGQKEIPTGSSERELRAREFGGVVEISGAARGESTNALFAGPGARERRRRRPRGDSGRKKRGGGGVKKKGAMLHPRTYNKTVDVSGITRVTRAARRNIARLN